MSPAAWTRTSCISYAQPRKHQARPWARAVCDQQAATTTRLRSRDQTQTPVPHADRSPNAGGHDFWRSCGACFSTISDVHQRLSARRRASSSASRAPAGYSPCWEAANGQKPWWAHLFRVSAVRTTVAESADLDHRSRGCLAPWLSAGGRAAAELAVRYRLAVDISDRRGPALRAGDEGEEAVPGERRGGG
jgi:hypothetical protein